MKIVDYLSQNKDAILRKWFRLLLDSYPEETSRFIKKEKDPFANPVGSTISKGIEGVFEALISGTDSDNVSSFLDRIIKIRAIQDFPPSQAVAFVFLLKKVIRDELGGKIQKNEFLEELLSLESKIDELALLSFDIYMKCREKVYTLKADEVKRRYSNILKRFDLSP